MVHLLSAVLIQMLLQEAEKRVKYASTITSADSTNGHGSDTDSNLEPEQREAKKQRFLAIQEQRKIARRERRKKHRICGFKRNLFGGEERDSGGFLCERF